MNPAGVDRSLGLELTIDCPACRRSGVVARAFEQHDRVRLLEFIPITILINTWVTCGSCGRRLHARVRLARLAAMTQGQRSSALRVIASPFERFLAAIALIAPLVPFLMLVTAPSEGAGEASIRAMLSYFPFLALIAGIVGSAVNWRTPGWPRLASFLGMGASILLCVIAILKRSSG